MRTKTAGPRGLLPDTAPQNLGKGHDTGPFARQQPARCELHDVRLSHRLPPRCPLATPNPLETLGRLQDVAWRVLGRGFADAELPDALAMLDKKDLCISCLDRNLKHPTTQRLRRGLRGAA